MIGSVPVYIGILRQIEVSPYVSLSRAQFASYEFESRHGCFVKVYRGSVDDQHRVFCWYAHCLDEDDEKCGHVSCERALRRRSSTI